MTASTLQGWIIFGDERMGRMLEIELERMGIPARAFDLPPTTPQPLRILIWDADTHPITEGRVLAAKSGCPLVTVGREPSSDPLHLRRPFLISDLETLLRKLLSENSHPTAPPSLYVGDGTVAIGGIPVPLTDAELRIFSALYERRGEVVPREELATLLGGGGNSVEVYVCHLRRKLEAPLGRRTALITTLRGVGYRMELL